MVAAGPRRGRAGLIACRDEIRLADIHYLELRRQLTLRKAKDKEL
jgi:hypothetical protein